MIRNVFRRFSACVLSFVFTLGFSVTACYAQANFAGSEALVTSLQNEMVSGFAVDPAGNIYICDSSANQLDEAEFSAGSYGALSPVVTGMCSPNSTSPPLAVDALGYFYYATSSQVWKAKLSGGVFGTPLLVAGGLNEPGSVAVDIFENVYIDVTGTSQVIRLAYSGGAYLTPTAAMSGYNGILAVDASGSVYVAGGYGPASGFVVKAAFNGSSYSTPQTLYSGFNDLTGMTVDALGNVFVSSDDSYQSPITGNVNSPGAIVDLFELPIMASGSYGLPVPMGGGDFYIAQGAASDAFGNVYALWIGGPRGGFSYNVEKVNPQNLVSVGAAAVGSSAQQQVTFWVTGTELVQPTVSVSTQGVSGTDFTTSGGVNCVPDAGLPFNEYGYPVACSATVTFTPQTTGVRTGGALLISASSGNPIASVNLAGTGLGPHLALNQGASMLFTTGISPDSATATDAQGNFYTADPAHQTIVKLPWNGGSFGSPVTIATGLGDPDGIAVDGPGDVFVSDSNSAQVVKIPLTSAGYGTPDTIFNSTMFSFEGGTQSFAPNSLAVDLAGNLFILELETSQEIDNVIVELPWQGNSYGAPFEVSGDGFQYGRTITTDGTNLFVVQGVENGGPTSSEQILEFQRVPGTFPGFAPPVTIVGQLAGTLVSADGNGNLYYLDQSFSGLYLDEVVEASFQPNGLGRARIVYSQAGSVFSSLSATPDGNLLVENYGSYTVQNGNPVLNTNGAGLIRVDRSTANPLTFLSTNVGATSTDSPHTVVVENIGNEPLSIASLTYPVDFPEAVGDSSACVAASLAHGASCDLPVQFTPLSSGVHVEAVSFQNNSLNHAGTVQKISVTGTGNGPATDAQIQLSISSSAYVYPGRATVTVTLLPGSSSTAPTGTVRLMLDGTLLTTLTLSGAGHGNAAAYFQLPVLSAASHTLQAVYSGDAKNPAGTSQPLEFSVLPAPVSLAVSCSNATLLHGGNFTCHVYTSPIAAGAGTLFGVQYDGIAPYTVTLDGGTGVFSIPDPGIGPHQVVISYAPQGSYAAAASKTVNFTVIAP